MYAITGATGNTGKVIVEKLLARGEKVRVIGRDAARLAPLVQKGAEAFVADVTDSSAMVQAFTGARAVYVMIPPNLAAPDARAYQEQVSDSLAQATEKAGAEYAVLLSSVGADKTERTGPVVGLHNFEQKLNDIARLKALHLRAGYFMENLLPQVNVIKSFGMMAGPVRADLKLPFIATRDIGAFAAEALLALNFTGKQTRELLGQRDATYHEAAAVVGKAIGKPDLTYSQLPLSQLKPALTQMGMSTSMADLLLEMAEALNSGYMAALEPRSAQNTTPTSIEQFVTDEFAPRFTGKAVSA
ncbi:MAG TPA: NmrA family NAD(P)-binding protein [Terriglobia bacterium]|nr:NmrA family NAD(P)-binding protein [Terriglobia bacterium]